MPLASRLALVTNEETNETMTCLPILEAIAAFARVLPGNAGITQAEAIAW